MDEAAPPSKRTEWWPILLLILAVGGSAIGIMLYQRSQASPASADASGFDIAQTQDAKTPTLGAGNAASRPNAPQSSLTTASWGNALTKTNAPADPMKASAEAFADICRAYEDRVRTMAERYTRESPVIQAYGKEWMSYPDLKKLNDDYMVQHDPVAFLHGLATSKNFGHMVAKYARYPIFLSFVQEAMKAAPPDARQVAMDYIDKDKVASGVIDNALQAIGMPAGIVGSASRDSSGALNVDPSKMLNSMIGSSPEMQKQMQQQGGANNPLGSQEFQQKLKSIKAN